MDLEAYARVVAEASGTHDVTTRRRALRAGLTDDQVTRLVGRGQWRRLHRGVLLTHAADPLWEAALAAARFAAGDGLEPAGVICGPTAARLWDLPAAANGAVEVNVPGVRRRAVPGVRYRYGRLAAADACLLRGLPVTTPLRTVAAVLHGATYDAGLVLADAALRRGLVRREDLATLRVSPRVARALAAADPRAESPFESRVRAEILRAGLPPPVLQHVVTDRHGRFVARVDLAWPTHRLVVEADGASVHASAAALRDDVRRQNAIVAAGWLPLRFTWADLGAIAPRVATALGDSRLRAA